MCVPVLFSCFLCQLWGFLKLKILSYFRASIVNIPTLIWWNFPNCMIFETQIGYLYFFKAFNSFLADILWHFLSSPRFSVCLSLSPPFSECGRLSGNQGIFTPALCRICTLFLRSHEFVKLTYSAFRRPFIYFFKASHTQVGWVGEHWFLKKGGYVNAAC